LLGWIFAGAAAAAADAPNPRFTGAAFTRTWLADDYGAAPGNRAILQHPKSGFIYVGNGAGVMEFDGARWRLLPVPGGLAVSALAVDGRGRIWFATDDDVGCFQADAVGELRAVSARSRLPAGEPSIFPLGSCLATGDAVYFANRDRIFRFGGDDAPPRIWRFDTELFPRLWLMDGAVHVRTTNAAARLVDDEFKPVAGLRTFAFATRADPAGGWQMISRDGVRRWADTYQPVAPDTGVLRSPFSGDFALNGTFLSDGRIAFGTTRSGLIICDAHGVHVQSIDRGRGLPSNRIEALCVDRTGGVWLALRTGIVRVQLDSPYALHASLDGRIDSSPQALALHAGQLYVGGGEGLSRRDETGVFHALADVPYLVRSLVSHADRLFVTGIELREVLPNDGGARCPSSVECHRYLRHPASDYHPLGKCGARARHGRRPTTPDGRRPCCLARQCAGERKLQGGHNRADDRDCAARTRHRRRVPRRSSQPGVFLPTYCEQLTHRLGCLGPPRRPHLRDFRGSKRNSDGNRGLFARGVGRQHRRHRHSFRAARRVSGRDDCQRVRHGTTGSIFHV